MNDYYRLDISIRPASTDACDLAADSLAAIGFESFEQPEEAGGASMTAYVPAPLFDAEAAREALAEIEPLAVADFEAVFVKGRDWNSEWEKNYFKPILVAGRVAVHSSFYTDVPPAEFDIVIDPKMAFGTGHHATTTLMMKALLSGNIAGASVIDMGTGTGILAILASMLGAAEVAAVEIDPFAAANAADNVALNLGNDSAVEVLEGDESALGNIEFKADVFLANINRNVITADIEAYAAALKTGGRLVVSGFYVADREIVAEAATRAGFDADGVDEFDGWSSMQFVKR